VRNFFSQRIFLFFRRFFLSCHTLSILSFPDHHFFSSRLSHSASTATRLGTHLPHAPLHLSTPCLCMLRVVFLPKTLLFTSHTLFFCSLQAREQVVLGLWKGLSRCLCSCRSPPIPTTQPNYNFANTLFFFCLCAVKWTQLLSPQFLGPGSKTPKEGEKQSLPTLLSCSPFSPYPSPLFALFSAFFFALKPLCLS
jgi:hypothetical protein